MKKKPVSIDLIYKDLYHILINKKNPYAYEGVVKDLYGSSWGKLCELGCNISESDISNIINKLCHKYKANPIKQQFTLASQISEAVDVIFDDVNPCESTGT